MCVWVSGKVRSPLSLCDSVWQVTLRSCEMGTHEKLCPYNL